MQKRLRESSPLRRAAEIKVPVLLGHGEDDQRVHVRESRLMSDALETGGAGNSNTWSFPHEDPRIRAREQPDPVVHAAWPTFLEENLAPRQAAAARDKP